MTKVNNSKAVELILQGLNRKKIKNHITLQLKNNKDFSDIKLIRSHQTF